MPGIEIFRPEDFPQRRFRILAARGLRDGENLPVWRKIYRAMKLALFAYILKRAIKKKIQDGNAVDISIPKKTHIPKYIEFGAIFIRDWENDEIPTILDNSALGRMLNEVSAELDLVIVLCLQNPQKRKEYEKILKLQRAIMQERSNQVVLVTLIDLPKNQAVCLNLGNMRDIST